MCLVPTGFSLIGIIEGREGVFGKQVKECLRQTDVLSLPRRGLNDGKALGTQVF